MKTLAERTSTAFTLIELIGVMAIIAILAGIMTPSILHSIDLAEVRTEAQTLSSFADQIRQRVHDTSVVPNTNTWTTDIAPYVDYPVAAIAQNRRARARVYLTDPATIPSQRAIFLSVVTTNATLVLPAQGTMTTASFQTLWDTVEHTVPTGWAAAWTTVPNSSQYLVIQRVNLKADLPSYSIILNNKSLTVNYRVGYIVKRADGTILPMGTLLTGPTGPVPTSASITLVLGRGDRIELYSPSTATTPDYTYVISNSGKTLDYRDDTRWLAQ